MTSGYFCFVYKHVRKSSNMIDQITFDTFWCYSKIDLSYYVYEIDKNRCFSIIR